MNGAWDRAVQTQHLNHYVLETWGIDYKQKLYRALVYLPDNVRIPLGYVVLRWPDPKLWDEYSKLKEKFLKKIEQRATGRKEYQEKIAREMGEDEGYCDLKNNGLRDTYIQIKYTNLTGDEVKMIRNQAELIKAGVL